MKLPIIDNAADYELRFHDDVWRQAAAVICARHRVSHAQLRRSREGENVIFFIDDRFVLKIFAPFRDGYRRERAALEFADGKLGLNTPSIVHTGDLEGWSYLVMTQLPGLPAREAWPQVNRSGRTDIVCRLGEALKLLHGYEPPLTQPGLDHDWRAFVEHQARTCVNRQRAAGANPEWLASLPVFLAARVPLLPADRDPVFLHGDVHLGNLLLGRHNGQWRVSGVVDFGDSRCGLHEYEFVAPGVLMVQGDRELQRTMLLAYGYAESELDADLRARLMLLTVLYECSNLRKYALRLRPDAVDYTLDELERAIWTRAPHVPGRLSPHEVPDVRHERPSCVDYRSEQRNRQGDRRGLCGQGRVRRGGRAAAGRACVARGRDRSRRRASHRRQDRRVVREGRRTHGRPRD